MRRKDTRQNLWRQLFQSCWIKTGHNISNKISCQRYLSQCSAYKERKAHHCGQKILLCQIILGETIVSCGSFRLLFSIYGKFADRIGGLLRKRPFFLLAILPVPLHFHSLPFWRIWVSYLKGQRVTDSLYEFAGGRYFAREMMWTAPLRRQSRVISNHLIVNTNDHSQPVVQDRTDCRIRICNNMKNRTYNLSY